MVVVHQVLFQMLTGSESEVQLVAAPGWHPLLAAHACVPVCAGSSAAKSICAHPCLQHKLHKRVELMGVVRVFDASWQ